MAMVIKEWSTWEQSAPDYQPSNFFLPDQVGPKCLKNNVDHFCCGVCSTG